MNARFKQDLVLVAWLVPVLALALILYLHFLFASMCAWDQEAASASPDGRAMVVVWSHGCGALGDTTWHARLYGRAEPIDPDTGVEVFWTDEDPGPSGSPPWSRVRLEWGNDPAEPCLFVDHGLDARLRFAPVPPATIRLVHRPR